MNDTELDDLLDQWTAPAPSPDLRNSLRTTFAGLQAATVPTRAPRNWQLTLVTGARRALLAAAVVVVGVFLFSVAQALSQTPPSGRIPYTVESEYRLYEEGGTPAVAMVTTSYMAQDGAETVLSRSMPGSQLGTLLGRKLDLLLPVWQRMITPFVAPPNALKPYQKAKTAGFHSVLVIPGCADENCLLLQKWSFPKGPGRTGTSTCMDAKVVGVETILGHPTTAVQTNFRPNRLTMWLAPDLGCFPLRINSEQMRPDGSFRVWQSKEALKITMNP
ncbi:MAG: hypothetical protein ABI806_28755 [Candidatus Solibacter sp.]